jgi:hypothetical protein
MFKRFSKFKFSPARNTSSTRDLIRQEAAIGGTLFGPVAEGHKRQFFCLDKHAWVWHEEWQDQQTGQRQQITTRYEIRETGILKAQGNHPYHFVDTQEEKNLLQAIKLYYKYVMRDVYGQNV